MPERERIPGPNDLPRLKPPTYVGTGVRFKPTTFPEISPVSERLEPLAAHIFASITSLDDGTGLVFAIEPSEQDREYSAQWAEAGVAQASPQFLEFQHSNPEKRVIKAYFDAYSNRAGGIANSIEGELAVLKKLTRRVAGKKHAHRCLFTQGEQSMKCVVESVGVPVKRIGQTGGAIQAYEVPITLREIP